MSKTHHDLPPTRRNTGVESREFDAQDGTVVVDVTAQTAHRLDPVTATIWNLSDGQRSVADIATGADTTVAAVDSTLDELSGLGLLEETDGHTRRSVMVRGAKFGATVAVAAPLIETFVLPTALAAASTLPTGTLTVMTTGDYTLTTSGGTTSSTITKNGSLYIDASGNVTTTAPTGSYAEVSLSGNNKFVTITNSASSSNSISYSIAMGTSGNLAAGTNSTSQTFSGTLTVTL